MMQRTRAKTGSSWQRADAVGKEKEGADMRGFMTGLFVTFFLFLPVFSYGMESRPSNSITVRFDLARHLLKGVSKIVFPAGGEAAIDLSGLRILSATVNGAALETAPDTSVVTFGPSSSAETVVIEYEMEAAAVPASDMEKNPGVVEGNLIDPSGIVLMRGWYPSAKGLSVYSLTAVLPPGFEGISEADQVTVREGDEGKREFVFSFPHPVAGITLVGGNYKVESADFGGIEIAAYFLPEDAGLAKQYIEYTKKYLGMYDDLIGPYRYKRFSIVENVLPTGYSFPTYTLLGSEVVRLPFILETSLGHEILHQWFGNMVYVDYQGGNWSEGLTTYLADQRFEELKGKGWDYRKQILISFGSYVNADNDFSLTAFTGRTDYASRAIGYGKCAMVFHMLRKLVGDQKFFDAVRAFVEKNSFRPASWSDIKTAFETVAGKDLSWYFTQWLEEKGGPQIGVKNVALSYRGSTAVVSFELEQKDKEYKFLLPVALKTKEGETRRTFEIEKKETRLEIETKGAPTELVIDGDYDLFRGLSAREFPPVISRLLGDPKKIFVVREGKGDESAAVAGYLKGEGFAQKTEQEVSYDDLKASSLLVFGSDSRLAESLFGKSGQGDEDFALVVRENPYNPKGVIAVVDGPASGGMAGYLRRMTHYGKYSRISFKGGRNTLKDIDESARGMTQKVAAEVPGVEIANMIDMPETVDKAAGKKIVYVGEQHDRFEHHRVEYEVIRRLHEKGNKIAIGMEMFQKPFQTALDGYISGAIDEREFLKKSEYFKRWGFDYTLYREILLYAREYKIPVVALNIRKEIVSKVFREGQYSLTPEERKEIPPDMDLSDMAYKSRLKRFFEEHRSAESRNFDFFYQAQVLWDESMAHNLAAFMKKNPDYQVVVVAGMGHLAFGSGIPKRAYRLNGQEYSIILNDGDIEKNISDFVLFPSPIKPPETPKLGVILKEEKGMAAIEALAPGGVAEQAGLRKGDAILAMDDTKIEGADDVRIFLLYKKPGDSVLVRVRRPRFLFGPYEKEIRVVL
jgi:aminopeptidase N